MIAPTRTLLRLGGRRRYLDRRRLRHGSSTGPAARSSTPTISAGARQLQPEDPSKPEGQKYGYGISQLAGDRIRFIHGGEMPGSTQNQLRPTNKLTLIIWTI